MSTEKFFQLVTIPDYRFSSDKEQCQNIDFDKIATDCDTKQYLFCKPSII